MSDIVNIEAYAKAKEAYVTCEIEVDMEAHGVNSWRLVSVDGVRSAHPHILEMAIDPITYDQVDAAARLQLRGER